MGDKDEQRGECCGKRSNLQRRRRWGGLGLECWQPITFSSQDGSLQEHQLYKHHTRSITFQYHCSIYSNLLLRLLLQSRTCTPLVAYNIPTTIKDRLVTKQTDEDASSYHRTQTEFITKPKKKKQNPIWTVIQKYPNGPKIIRYFWIPK